MKASLITIGTELLIGQVIDTNSAYLGEQLSLVGIDVSSRISVADGKEDILKALTRAEEDADIIFITGGLGPTKDDITKSVLAEHLGVSLYFDENQYENILRFFAHIKRPTTEAHKNQCYFPETVQLLENKMGTAAGMLFHHNEKRIISMPGVPYEMKHIMAEQVLPLLKNEQETFILHKTIQTAGVGETILADLISDIEEGLSDHVSLAYLPSLGKVRVRVTVKGKDKNALQNELEKITDEIVGKFGPYVFGYDTDSLQKAVGHILSKKKMLLGLAESCTGGAVSRLITSIPGSSAYFQGAIVSYSNDVKTKLLGVDSKILANHGAVSEETVKQMVLGAEETLSVDVAVAISGIAGPTSGSDEKPVGTIWFACGNKDRMITKKLNLTKNRLKNIEYSSYFALNLLRIYLENESER